MAGGGEKEGERENKREREREKTRKTFINDFPPRSVSYAFTFWRAAAAASAHSHLVINKISLISEMETRARGERCLKSPGALETQIPRRSYSVLYLYAGGGDKYEIKNDVFDQHEKMLKNNKLFFCLFFLFHFFLFLFYSFPRAASQPAT